MVELRLDPRRRARLDASDGVQEAFLDAARDLDAYLADPKLPLLLWLRLLVMMTRHKLAKQDRRHRADRRDYRRLKARDPAELDGRSAAAPSPSRLVAGRELLEEFRRRLSDESGNWPTSAPRGMHRPR
jgi:RNA polymerase sigma-70 factor (ECF subfamily)